MIRQLCPEANFRPKRQYRGGSSTRALVVVVGAVVVVADVESDMTFIHFNGRCFVLVSIPLPPPPLHLLPSSAAKTCSHSSLLSKIGSVRRWRRRAAITAGKNAVQSAVHTTTQSCRQSCCSCRPGGGRLTELC